MIPDVSQALAWLEKHPQALQGIQRGLERETLRVNADGTLATTGHPPALLIQPHRRLHHHAAQ
ncbi:hypothetical protein, partial [Klebsiella pneumoniae]|uniref:hypothetical protein n=1 Tax=Klebsiella pneumoniae TaxID=573 RepID=UPI003968268A